MSPWKPRGRDPKGYGIRRCGCKQIRGIRGMPRRLGDVQAAEIGPLDLRQRTLEASSLPLASDCLAPSSRGKCLVNVDVHVLCYEAHRAVRNEEVRSHGVKTAKVVKVACRVIGRMVGHAEDAHDGIIGTANH